MPTFQYYKANIKESTPLGIISLERFIEAIREPKEAIQDVFEKIKEAELAGDMKLKADLKTHLFSFTPAVYVIGRRQYTDIHSFTGLMPLDFDHLESVSYAEEFRDYLFDEYDFVVASWLSASGLGVRALVRTIPVGSVKEYKELFEGLAMSEMYEYAGFDTAPKNCVLPLFLSYDPDIKYRPLEECSIWDIAFVEDEPEVQPIRTDYVAPEGIEKRLAGIIDSAVNKIVDNGHPQIRSISFIMGGYVASGVIDWGWAEDYLFRSVDSNAYLVQKASVYKKTVKDMLKRGMSILRYLD